MDVAKDMILGLHSLLDGEQQLNTASSGSTAAEVSVT